MSIYTTSVILRSKLSKTNMRHIIHHKHKKVIITHPIDRLALIVGFLQPLATIPQIWLVFTSGDASQVSIFTWAAFNVASVVILWYGLKHKLPPVWIPQIVWILVQTPMMIAPLIFS